MNTRALLVTVLLGVVGCGSDRGETPPPQEGFFSVLTTVPPPEFTVGDEDAFGSVASLLRLPSGDLIVADGMNGQLKVYSDRQPVSSFGRLGGGPMEFRGLGSVVAARGDTLIVHDARQFALRVFVAEGDSLVRLHNIDLPFAVAGVCTIGNRIFVLGEHGDHLVHETNTAGELVRSFGTVEGADPFDRALSSGGEIACGPENIGLASKALGVLQIFSASGTLEVRDSIPDFVAVTWERTEYAMRPLPPPLGFAHIVENLHWFGSDLLVQLRRSPNPDELMLESRWFADTGTWRDELAAWPRILAHTPDGLVFATVDDPYPIINAYQVRD